MNVSERVVGGSCLLGAILLLLSSGLSWRQPSSPHSICVAPRVMSCCTAKWEQSASTGDTAPALVRMSAVSAPQLQKART